ncbi:Hypothetical protein GLP15_3886 [Giardia lamblia P15]|uniref:Uncharacterized protein n=1 Tax=Giardia intestinalis (strain P15) TaxID=658858 RepID=E1F0L9_GIAIA|nr:Hypothetical protein GLP15_3886 [Giardia lamblia P15]
MIETFLGISSIEANRPLTVAELKKRTERETGIPSSACTVYRLRRISRSESLTPRTKICAIVPSQATRLSVGVLNALSQSFSTHAKAIEPDLTHKVENASSSLSIMHHKDQEEQSADTFITTRGLSLEDRLQRCIVAKDLFALCDAFRLRYIIAKETHETVVRMLESLKGQLEMATRGPRTEFEANLLQHVHKNLVTSVSERKGALLVALETEIAEEELMEIQFASLSNVYR